jgi:hypothetical protein
MNDGIAVAELMDELTSVAQRQRDPSIPAGTVLAESVSTDGAGNLLQVTREVKQHSMVKNGKVELPERFPAFDKFGNLSMLPTAQMGKMLSKERADAPGERAFHTHTRGMTRDTCSICPAEKQPIEALCPFCTGARAIKNTFTSEQQFITHKQLMHALEFETEERALDRAQAQANITAQQRIADAQERLAEAMIATQQPRPARKSEEPAEPSAEISIEE